MCSTSCLQLLAPSKVYTGISEFRLSRLIETILGYWQSADRLLGHRRVPSDVIDVDDFSHFFVEKVDTAYVLKT